MMESAGEPRWTGRRRARAAALQVLYECEVGRLAVGQALGVLDRADDPDVAVLEDDDRRFAETLARGVLAEGMTLDERIGQAARHWRVERMATIDRLVLRMAVHEWLTLPQTPPRVVLNEAIELARAFSGEDAAKFVNGVLDGVFRTLKTEGKVVE